MDVVKTLLANAARTDLERYRWLELGGWEVLQDPKYWLPQRSLSDAIDAAMQAMIDDA